MNILVTGGNGLVGNGIRSICLEPEFSNLNIIFVGRNECNLLKKDEINRLIDLTRPDAIIHTAARVGGIGMNISTPSEQYYENIIMNTELIESAYKFGVNNLISFSSVCAFPSGLDKLSEDLLHKAEPYPAHRSYAYAKRMVDIQIESYRNQYGSNYCSVIPGNIFGKNDNFNLENGHVIPSLIHRCYLSKINNEKFEVWGDGEPQREFIYSEDIARACLALVQNNSMPQRIIMSGRKEHKIKDVVNIICNQFDHHDVTWLKDKPNGQMRRPSNKKIFDKYLPDFKFTDIEKSIGETTQWFKSKYPGVRK
jgi:GDP-L-fucose synthase